MEWQVNDPGFLQIKNNINIFFIPAEALRHQLYLLIGCCLVYS